MKTIHLIGLDWETENRSDYETFHDAQKLAESAGVRVPTEKEWEELCELPNCWDNDKKGRWFAESIRDLGDPEKSIFLPAAGRRDASGTVLSQGTYGHYWSSVPSSSSYGYRLYFNSSYVNPVEYSYYAFGYAVRCVRL